MKLSNATRYPYPVLWSATGDYVDPSERFGFAAGVELEEVTASPRLRFSLELEQKSLRGGYNAGAIHVGVAVRCEATYVSMVRACPLGSNVLDFEPMLLSGEVRLRPIAWRAKDGPPLRFHGVHEEFGSDAFEIKQGAVLAVGDECVLYIGREKSTPLASIFELRLWKDLDTNTFSVDLDAEQIAILAGPAAHARISELRAGDQHARYVVLCSVYLPVVQAALQAVADGGAQYEGKRWYTVLCARLNSLGIDVNQVDPLPHAQQLLGHPLAKLELEE